MSEDGYIHITDEVIKNSIQTRKAIFDKNGEVHYDNISAFIKSMRGSDPDATVFYLARALNGGEDPMFLARRIAICAAEDKMRELGYNEGYLYPHDFPGHYVEQQYLPDQMLGTKYYKFDWCFWDKIG